MKSLSTPPALSRSGLRAALLNPLPLYSHNAPQNILDQIIKNQGITMGKADLLSLERYLQAFLVNLQKMVCRSCTPHHPCAAPHSSRFCCSNLAAALSSS